MGAKLGAKLSAKLGRELCVGRNWRPTRSPSIMVRTERRQQLNWRRRSPLGTEPATASGARAAGGALSPLAGLRATAGGRQGGDGRAREEASKPEGEESEPESEEAPQGRPIWRACAERPASSRRLAAPAWPRTLRGLRARRRMRRRCRARCAALRSANFPLLRLTCSLAASAVRAAHFSAFQGISVHFGPVQRAHNAHRQARAGRTAAAEGPPDGRPGAVSPPSSAPRGAPPLNLARRT